MSAEPLPESVDDIIDDILKTMKGMKLADSETILINLDFTDRLFFPDPEAFFTPLLSGVTQLRGRRSVHVRYDSRIDAALASTAASQSLDGFDAYRLVFFGEEETDFTLQYATSRVRNAVQVLYRFRRSEAVTVSLLSVSYIHLSSTPELDEDSLADYFDRIVPGCLHVPAGREIIDSLGEKGWRLYEVHGSGSRKYISAADGPAELLVYGRNYSLVPAAGDETSRECIMSAMTHATATGQFVLHSENSHSENSSSLPIVMLHFGSEGICLVDCYGGHKKLRGNSENFPGFVRRHFAAYDSHSRIADEKLH